MNLLGRQEALRTEQPAFPVCHNLCPAECQHLPTVQDLVLSDEEGARHFRPIGGRLQRQGQLGESARVPGTPEVALHPLHRTVPHRPNLH